MKEYNRFVKSLTESFRAFSKLVEAVGENLEKNLEVQKQPLPKAAKLAGRGPRRASAIAARPVRPAAVRPAAGLKRARPSRMEGATVLDSVLKVVEENSKGIGVGELKEKTGFNDKQIQNTVYRLKKQGKITAMGKGIYVPASMQEA